jgi:XTP/dITP diphosphohydrolase
MNLILVTSNPNKAREVQALLGQPIETVALDLPEIQSISVEEVVREKAQEAYRRLGRPLLVEDTGLSFNAWNGLPGALVRWFLKSAGNEGLCQMLSTFADRGAQAVTCLGYADGHSVQVFCGRMEGTVAPAPRGENGFGWDAIFIPRGSELTFAEMNSAQKDAVSMRKLALQDLLAFLKEG